MPTTGPNFPSAATGNTNVIGGGTRLWTNPGNITANDANNATVSFLAGVAASDDLIGTGFGFTIAGSDTINGILLEVSYGINAAGNMFEQNVRLLKAGTASGTDKSTGAAFNTVSLVTVSYGGAADLWGTTWTPADINNANFGAAFICNNNGGGAGNGAVNFFRITVTSTSSAGVTSQMFKVF